MAELKVIAQLIAWDSNECPRDASWYQECLKQARIELENTQREAEEAKRAAKMVAQQYQEAPKWLHNTPPWFGFDANYVYGMVAQQPYMGTYHYEWDAVNNRVTLRGREHDPLPIRPRNEE